LRAYLTIGKARAADVPVFDVRARPPETLAGLLADQLGRAMRLVELGLGEDAILCRFPAAAKR
jgi:hypothetical protein